MRKIVTYQVTYDAVLGSLEADVNMMIDAGWQPICGICVNNETPPGFDERPIYYQAMVKYADDDDTSKKHVDENGE